MGESCDARIRALSVRGGAALSLRTHALLSEPHDASSFVTPVGTRVVRPPSRGARRAALLWWRLWLPRDGAAATGAAGPIQRGPICDSPRSLLVAGWGLAGAAKVAAVGVWQLRLLWDGAASIGAAGPALQEPVGGPFGRVSDPLGRVGAVSETAVPRQLGMLEAAGLAQQEPFVNCCTG